MYQDGFRRARDIIVFFTSISSGAATIISNGINFKGIVGRTLELSVDGAAAVLKCDFRHGDFADAAAPTVAEIVTVINHATRGIAGVTASALADGRLQIVSDTTGTVSQLVVGKGTANELFGWPTGFDVDASDQTAVVPCYETEGGFPPDISRWTYVAATQAFTRIIPTTGEVTDFDGNTVTVPGGVAAIHVARIRF